MDKAELRSKCCGATVMSAHGHSIYCIRCGNICETMSPELGRIERMLKWVIIKTMMVDRGELAGMNYSPEALGKQIDELVGELPDISDIIEKVK